MAKLFAEITLLLDACVALEATLQRAELARSALLMSIEKQIIFPNQRTRNARYRDAI